MNRLTEKVYCGYDVSNRKLKNDYTDEEIFKALQKLGRLEDIEEKLGIDLITLFKASSIWFLKEKETEPRLACNIHIDLYEKRFVDIVPEDRDIEPLYFYFKDYGKTWALTREELEND